MQYLFLAKYHSLLQVLKYVYNEYRIMLGLRHLGKQKRRFEKEIDYRKQRMNNSLTLPKDC